MPKGAENRPERYRYTQNRELSWLRFNQRVLEEAADESNPLLERLKFVAIFSSNLDEFFMVRVGSLFDLAAVSPEAVDNKTGMTPIQQLRRIYETVPGFIEQKKRIYAGVRAALAEAGVEDVTYPSLSAKEEKTVDRYFKADILPILSPIIIGSHHPVPHLVSKQLYVGCPAPGQEGEECGGHPAGASVPAGLCGAAGQRSAVHPDGGDFAPLGADPVRGVSGAGDLPHQRDPERRHQL